MKIKKPVIGGALAALTAAICLVLGISTINHKAIGALYLHANPVVYSLNLNTSNKITASGDHNHTTGSGAKVAFTYSNVSNSTSGHATLNENGYVVNKDQITSITRFTATFSGAGTLKARVAYVTDNWSDYFVLISGNTVDIGSNPYFLEIKAFGGSVVLESANYTYSCTANPAAQSYDTSGHYDIEFATNSGDNSTDISSTSSSIKEQVASGDEYISSFGSGSKIYAGKYGLKFGSSSATGALTINFNSSNVSETITTVTVSTAQYGTDTGNFNVYVNGSSTATTIDPSEGGTITVNASLTSLRFVTSTKRAYLCGLVLNYGAHVEPGTPDNPTPYEIGFTATDSKANNYKSTEAFDTANGLTVVANLSDGTTSPIAKGGANGYSYVVRDNSNNVVNTAAEFGYIGGKNSVSYTVIVSYKDYIPQEYTITITFVTKLVGIVVNCDMLEFNTAQKLSDYTECISADLTYNKTTLNVNDVPYSEFSDKALTLLLLDPNGVTYTYTNVFGTAGTWTLKLVSDEDSTVFGLQDIQVSAIPVQTISVTGEGGVATLQEEATLQLTASVTPNTATNKTVTWTSGDTAIATVNANGLVTGVSVGNVRITATAADGSQVFGYIDLSVTAKPVQTEFDAAMSVGVSAYDVTVNGETGIRVGTSKANGSMYIVIGKGATKLSFYAAAWNGASTTITLSTSTGTLGTSSIGLTADSGIAGSASDFTLNGDEDNYYYEVALTGINGDTTITVTGDARFVLWSAKYYTTQVDPVYPTSISLAGTNSISVGGTSQLSVDYLPADTNVKNVTFESNKTNIATVSAEGLITGVAAGSATITARAEAANNTTVSSTFNVTVTAVAVSSVSLSKSATTITAGSGEQLTATVLPENAGNKNVTWSTSNAQVATVSDGYVTGVAAGNATITVTTQDGSKTATCAVTVVASGGGSGSSGSATIRVSDIPTTYNTSSGNTSVDDFSFTVANVASSYTSGAMQWKKSSAGYIENTTPIEGLVNITIGTFSGKTFNGTLYSGNTQSPSTNSQSVSNGNTYTFSGSPSYFRLVVGSATGYTTDISIAYSTTPVDPTAITVTPSSAEIGIGNSKDLSVSYTPSGANQHKDVTWSRYSGDSDITVSSTGTVTVSNNANIGDNAVIRATLNYNSSIYSSCTVTVVGQQLDDQTILIYMCGSDLESNNQTNSSKASGYASGDITEILSVNNQPDDVNVVIETGGAKCWKSYNINANYLTRYHVSNKSLVQDQQISKANMGSTSTLQSFLTWGLQTYPAERVSLILWNHGGAMRGVCYDELYSSDSLTNSEVKTAVANSFNAVGRSTSDKLEWIGYDACLMQVQDIAEFNSQYFKYMVASEESEAGDGWDYDTWIDDVYAKKSTETILTAIVDGFIADTNNKFAANGWGASDQTLSWLDLSYMSAYKTAWETMASTVKTLISNKSSFQNIMKTVKYYGTDSECEGYSYFGIFDAKDTLNKLKNNYSGASTQITNALNAFANLVKYSKKGSGAGNSYGLCCFFPMKDNSGYTCSTSSVYTTSQTNFTNWRSIVTTYGD